MKRYEVIGPVRVWGHTTGQQFEKELTPGQEEALVLGGALAIVDWPDLTPKDDVPPPGPDRLITGIGHFK
jgi:hypothetical protein